MWSPTLFVISMMTLAPVGAFTVINSASRISSSPTSTVLHNDSGSGSGRGSNNQNDNSIKNASTRRSWFQTSSVALSTIVASSITTSLFPSNANARLDPVDNPSLLPSSPGEVVIQTEKFLTAGQVKRMSELIKSLERDTGFRLRVLCQSYPNTPGLAIRDYWDLAKEGQKDDKYIVLVVDQFGGRGNVLNFNVGDGVKFALPNVFWTRLSGKYGTTFFVRENGIDFAITNAIEAITQCLRSEDAYCVNVPDLASMKSLGL